MRNTRRLQGAGNPGTEIRRSIEAPAIRRSPRQQRSRAKVEAVLTAAEDIAADDVATMTTSSIARRAGISVGSLYQYFENREDIVERLFERYRSDLEEMMNQTLAARSVTSLHEGLGTIADAYVEFVRARPAFRVLWYSAEFVNPHRVVAEATDHALTALFLDIACQHGLVDTVTERLARSLLASWVALDAVIDVAFRLDAAGDPEMIDEASRITDAMATPRAA